MARLPYASATDRAAAEAFFQKRGAARTLFEALGRTVAAFGKHAITATRSRVAFTGRTRFLWVHEANEDGAIWVGFLLPRPLDSPKARSARAGSRWSHHVKIGSLSDLDGEVVAWLNEAYDYDMAKPAPKAAVAKTPAKASAKRPARPKGRGAATPRKAARAKR